MVRTIYGDMDEALLIRKEFFVDNDNEYTTAVEYWLKDELVHRSAHVRLKKGLGIESALGRIG